MPDTNLNRTITLVEAIFENDFERLQQLLEVGADVNAIDEKGDTLIDIAIKFQRVKMVELLIANGANVNGRGNYPTFIPPLYLAAKLGYTEIVQLLIEKEANLTLQNDRKPGRGVLQALSREDNFNEEIACLFIKAGFACKGKNNDISIDLWFYCLMDWAAQFGWVEMIQLLIEKGVNIKIQDSKNNTLLHYMTREKHKRNFSEESQKEVITLLVTQGLDLGKRNNADRAPLQFCSKEILDYLYETTRKEYAASNLPSLSDENLSDKVVRIFLLNKMKWFYSHQEFFNRLNQLNQYTESFCLASFGKEKLPFESLKMISDWNMARENNIDRKVTTLKEKETLLAMHDFCVNNLHKRGEKTAVEESMIVPSIM